MRGGRKINTIRTSRRTCKQKYTPGAHRLPRPCRMGDGLPDSGTRQIQLPEASFGPELDEVVHDEEAADIEFDVVPLRLELDQVEVSPARNEAQPAEHMWSLGAEMLLGQVVLPVVGRGPVERGVLLVVHVLGLARPQRTVFFI